MFKRILLKLSGESLQGNSENTIDFERVNQYAADIKAAADMGIEIGIVIGGGNIFRGVSGASKGFDRVKGDQMGMLATVINSLALESTLNAIGKKAKLFTATPMSPIGQHFTKDKAIENLKKGYVVIIAGGTGNPYFTTDTASALRGVEIEADVFLKGTRVDGVYTADPEKDKNAIKYETLTFDEAYNKGLKIMDLTAFTMCKENNLSVLVFDMNEPGNLVKVLNNIKLGTLITV